MFALSLLISVTAVTALVPASSSSHRRRNVQESISIPQRQDSHSCFHRPTILFATPNKESTETEAERLLRKARELRAAAEQDEQKVHDSLTKKKADRDAQTDRLIEELFFPSGQRTSADSVVDRLRTKRPGLNTLEAVVDRLDEREVIAQGLDHVQFKMVGDKTKFHRVNKKSNKDEAELKRLEGLIDQLIQAAAVLDEEFMAGKKAKGQVYVAHAEEEHWGGGKCAKRLESRIREIRRARSDQFQKRMEEFREAQRRKDDDDHKFKGYTDLGNLN